MWRDRPKDAYAALQYLQAQPFVKADHVGLIGWSQGGGVVLLSINDKSIGRPEGLAPLPRTNQAGVKNGRDGPSPSVWTNVTFMS